MKDNEWLRPPKEDLEKIIKLANEDQKKVAKGNGALIKAREDFLKLFGDDFHDWSEMGWWLDRIHKEIAEARKRTIEEVRMKIDEVSRTFNHGCTCWEGRVLAKLDEMKYDK